MKNKEDSTRHNNIKILHSHQQNTYVPKFSMKWIKNQLCSIMYADSFFAPRAHL